MNTLMGVKIRYEKEYMKLIYYISIIQSARLKCAIFVETDIVLQTWQMISVAFF